MQMNASFEHSPCTLIYHDECGKIDGSVSGLVRQAMERRRRKKEILDELDKQEEEQAFNHACFSECCTSSPLQCTFISAQRALSFSDRGRIDTGSNHRRRERHAPSRSLSSDSAISILRNSRRDIKTVFFAKAGEFSHTFRTREISTRCNSYGYSEEQRDRLVVESIRASVQKHRNKLNRNQIVQNALKLEAELKVEENALAMARSGAVDEAMVTPDHTNKTKLTRSGRHRRRLSLNGSIGSGDNLADMRAAVQDRIVTVRSCEGLENMRVAVRQARNRLQRPCSLAPSPVHSPKIGAKQNEDTRRTTESQSFSKFVSKMEMNKKLMLPSPGRRGNKSMNESGLIDIEERQSISPSSPPVTCTPEQERVIDRHLKQIQLHMRTQGLVTGLGLKQIIREVRLFDS